MTGHWVDRWLSGGTPESRFNVPVWRTDDEPRGPWISAASARASADRVARDLADLRREGLR